MEGLSFENILGENEIENLFVEPESVPSSEDDSEKKGSDGGSESSEASDNPEENDDTKKTTEAVNPEELFAEDEMPESVGSEKNKEQGDATTDEDSGTSPKNFYSSIANALAVDGVFPNLDEEKVKQADTAEGLSDLIEAEVMARLDEKQQRISKALENGVEPSDIRKYEGTLNFLSRVTEQQVIAENEEGENLRKNLIYQDFLNRGMSPEKAQKYTERSIESGNDVEDAKEALQSNKEYFQREYNKLLKNAQDEAEEERRERQEQANKLKESIMKDKTLLGDIDVSTELRRKTMENISKPVYKDPETGEYLTALQKYQMEHRADFLKYVGLFMTLTNGFKDFDSFIKGKVKKETKKGLSALEKTLNGTRRNPDGSLKMVTSVREDPESFIGSNWKLDI